MDMAFEIAGDAVGEASAIKMIRSGMIKGMEALTAECRAGSLQASSPGINRPRQAACNLERMMVHSRRRTAEMREVAATLDELGLPSAMARVTANGQQRIGDLELPAGDDAFAVRADAILWRMS